MAVESRTLDRGTNAGWVKWAAVTLVFAILTFVSSPNGPLGVFWRPSPALPAPAGFQLPLFMLLNAAEAVSFGLGVSFFVFGYPHMRSILPTSRKLTFAAYLSIGWLLANWWPHDSLHLANGFYLNGLLAIEYAFHITLIIAGIILAIFFLTLLRQKTQPAR